MSQARGVSPLLGGPNELKPAADQALRNSVGAIGWPAKPVDTPFRGCVAPGVERRALAVGAPSS
jgi:hypothetical protein